MYFIIKDCNIKKIKDSGQSFRISKLDNGSYFVISGGRACRVFQLGYDMKVYCNDLDEKYWLYYFDELIFGDNGFDYKGFEGKYITDSNNFIRESIEFGKGLRVLNQNPFECLISYIIFQRRSIHDTSGVIDKFCEEYGDVKYFNGIKYHAFPTPEKLVEIYNRDRFLDYSNMRGYQIYSASKRVLENKKVLEYLRIHPYNDALKTLRKFEGVGGKVANFVLIYSLGFKDILPRDIWINRVLRDRFPDSYFPTDKFEGVLGVLQLYMFYYERYYS